MIKNNKKTLFIVLIGFLTYFIVGVIFSYYLGTYKYYNVMFDIDTPRVVEDLMVKNGNHHRTSVHPLFVIIFQPICKVINYVIKDVALSCILVQSLIATLCLLFVYLSLLRIKLDNKTRNVLLLIFGASFSQIVFSSNIETYIFAQLFLVLLWLFVINKIDKEFDFKDYCYITLLGVGAIAVTLTNYMQFIIAVFFVLTLNKKVKQAFLKTLAVGICSLTISISLACVQNIIWPSAPNFFVKSIQDVISDSSQEKMYIDKSINTQKFINLFNAQFLYNYGIGKLYKPGTGIYVTFKSSSIINIISILIAFAFILLNIYYMIKTKFNVKDDKIYYSLMLALLFNMALHYFYGNSISFLYICHFNFLIILLLAYMISKLGIDIFKSKVSYIITIMILIIHSIAKIINLYIVLCPAYTKVEHFSLLPIIIIFLTVSCIVLLVFKKGIIKILSVIICAVLLGVFYYNINYSKNIVCEINCEYEQKLELYKDQLKDMKNEYNVKSYIDREEKAQVMFFGMADRKKIIYKEGKLIDAKTQEVIKQFDYDKEVIIPNLYTVLLKKDDIEIVIEENEDGVFYIQNGKKETITTGKNKINLPDFEGKKYSEVLKVLHQEILFNIDGNEPKPNIFGYEQAYYRDATVVTKVLEKTNNTGLILEWVNNLEKIYDNSRSPSINEADNLGELLYIIGATKSSNKELMKKIIKEINSKKDENGFISGMVDGSIQTYYPTLLAIYGAEKNGIELDLKYPIIDDGYARLTWYSDYKVATMNSQTSSYYPYINWGFYHYSPWGDLFILDELYPLSYEGGEDDPNTKVENECFISKFYCEKDLYISHSWTASEIFLLIDEEA